ncbi:FtsX-like permease family protein [Carnobacterium sp.]|uniref:FtsX-like permease family protein n=1 Tax=Carnobacterium sp. TaxID=48221 RepID=UPI0038904751
MIFKMAVNNVKKSFKDYTIYFLTLTFSVCIFYSFNSIHAQTAVLEVGKSSLSYMQTLTNLISITSIFISFILGGLIVYANNFIIKRRTKELGIYMILGMGKNKMSKIFIYETLIIGGLSLGVGLFLGIIASQGVSVITANLFALNMTSFNFILSIEAIIKTVLYFGIAFIVVIVFNQVIISKYKLINMLNASKKNEDTKVKNPIISVIVFLLSVGMIGISYDLVIKVGLFPRETEFLLSVILGILGTLLCFYSLAGFFILIVQKNKKIYLKELNIFTLRQVNNKINTNFVSISVICLMLFVTMVSLFTMFSYKANLDESIEGNTSFDASAVLYTTQMNDEGDYIEEALNKLNFNFSESEDYLFFNQYEINLQVADLVSKYIDLNDVNDLETKADDRNIKVITVADYNAVIQLKNKQKVTLKNNEVLVVSNYGDKIESINKFMENEQSININSKQYNIKNKDLIIENIENQPHNTDFFYLVVPDNLSKELTLAATRLNVKFDDSNRKESAIKFATLFDNFNTIGGEFTQEVGFIEGYTKEQATAILYGNSAIIVFLGLYVGSIVLISSAAVLGIQQLSEANTSLDRYKALKKIGVTEKMINKTIFIQTLIAFIFPFVLAVIHSIVGIIVINNAFETRNKSVIGSSSLMISLVIAIIYGGYFYVTYVGYKNIVKGSS